jgi:uroporphyrin-III C-methyltransferase/precorrin-2 dehydrogenase/sirohydrochlorin ferrochelatase
MRSAPMHFDPASGTVALIGSGATALSTLRRLRSAGARVRWYTDNADVAEELLLASAPPGGLEFSLSDPLQADYSEFIAVVAASETALDAHVAVRARASNVAISVVDRAQLATFKCPAFDHGRDRDHRHARVKDIAI